MTNILEMVGISKVYSNGVYANKNINLDIEKGEIHALMGENGAGKSTLMKILFGLELPDEGKIIYKGKEVVINGPAQAINLGIGMVNQHFMLVDDLTVFENVILGMEPKSGLFIDQESAVDLVNKYAKQFNLGVNPLDTVGDLSVSQKQKVEILKVLTRGSELVILDEPTAVLTPQETEELFQQLKLLKDNGYTIIFITHKIQEVMKICDRITVLRKGREIGTIEVEGATPESISKMMVGRDVFLNIDKKSKNFGEITLNLDDVSVYDEEGTKVVDSVSFSIRNNEILGIAGVEGNGQSELADTIFGLIKANNGSIKLGNTEVSNLSIKERRDLGLGYIPEDRIKTGSAASQPIWENLIADKIKNRIYKKASFLDFDKIKKDSDILIDKYNITSLNQDQEVSMLSGGNMQKVVVARELSSDPQMLIANQPTRGIDVGAQEFIWNELIDFRDKGKSVLLISADLNELLALSDTVIVMLKGRVVAILDNSTRLSEEELGLYMLGVKKQHLESDKYEK